MTRIKVVQAGLGALGKRITQFITQRENLEIITESKTIPSGHASGVQQIGKGYINDEEKISLIFRASVGEVDPQDSIEIQGNPHIKSIIQGGLNGDVATCAITIIAVKQILTAQPGLRTMVDIPVVSFFQ